jgi:hypothetical protein
MTPPLHRLLGGPFHFLVPSAEEVSGLFPDGPAALPRPRRVFLEDEAATPLYGFPVLLTPGVRELERTLEETLRAEARLQLALAKRQSADSRAHLAAWDAYRALLERALTNVIASSYGQDQPAIFLLHHSLSVSRLVREVPRQILRDDPSGGRVQAESLRYRVLERLLDGILAVTYEVSHRQAEEEECSEDEVFPALFHRLRDNVLILSETHVSASLEELGGYFQAVLGVDGREFCERLARVAAWHEEESARSGALRSTARLLAAPEGSPRELFKRPGYMRWLAAQASERGAGDRFPPLWVETWENLLGKLKEFEVLQSLRKLVLPVERTPGGLVAAGRRSASEALAPLRLSPSTRPLDFLSTWVVSPEVERSGLIYDISDFSETLARLRWGGPEAQDDSFRSFFRFQRRIGRTAGKLGLKVEKYLGDGAFFSSRHAQPVLATAIRIQRAYADALRDGLPFDRGLRIALGFGGYRLIPVRDEEGGAVDRYEFFGQALIELTRLTSGKSAREIDELRLFLVTVGYPESAVNRFFAPLLAADLELVDRRVEARPFYAYLNRNGSLINEGIVATAKFVQRFAAEWRPTELGLWDDGSTSYVVIAFEDAEGVLRVGMRKLGFTNLKGIDRLVVYEVVDASAPSVVVDAPGSDANFLNLLDECFVTDAARRGEQMEAQ